MNTCPKCKKRILTDEESRTLTVNLKTICMCKSVDTLIQQRREDFHKEGSDG